MITNCRFFVVRGCLAVTQEFWRNCGYHLLSRGGDGFLQVQDDFLRAYLLRPELAPIAESCRQELRLHEKLAQAPFSSVERRELDAIEDEDARRNFQLFLNFRKHLAGAENLEQSYIGLFRGGAGIDFPPLFVDHLAQVILRNILSDVDDSFELRCAELFFREQDVQNISGAILLTDNEAAEIKRQQRAGSQISLLEMARTEAVLGAAELEVLSDENAAKYFARSERYEFALDMTFGRRGLSALSRVMERWIAHFLGVSVRIEPQQQVDDEHWSWHIGLDAEASALLNDLYQHNDVDDERIERLISLFRLTFEDAGDMRGDIAGRPVYLGLAAAANGRLRLKPQNLLVNLPLATAV
jgi:hypothetical protein